MHNSTETIFLKVIINTTNNSCTIKCLVYVRYHFKYFICIKSLTSHDNSIMWLLLSLIYRWKNWGMQRLRLHTSKLGFKPGYCGPRKPHLCCSTQPRANLVASSQPPLPLRHMRYSPLVCHSHRKPLFSTPWNWNFLSFSSSPPSKARIFPKDSLLFP
jgi:hypothetical protein